MKKKLTCLQADLILVLTALLWGTTFVASKFSLEQLPPLTIIAFRFILAVAFMSVLFRKHLRDISREDIKGGTIVGTVLFLGFATQLTALKYTDPGKQAFLATTYVIIVPFMVWLLYKKRPDARSFIGAFACLVGIGLLTMKQGLDIGFGDALTLFSSVFFAGHIITTEYYVKKSTPVKLALIQFGTVAILATVSALFIEGIPSAVPAATTVGILYLGIICTGIAYFLQTLAQNYTKSTHTAIIMSLEAVFGSGLSIVLMGEIFTFSMILGCAVIFGSILVIELKGSAEPKNKKQILEPGMIRTEAA